MDLVYPPFCQLCGKLGTVSPYLCEEHLGKVVPIRPPFCLRCGHPFAVGMRGPRCPLCRGRALHFSRARGGALYRDSVRDLILKWKLGRDRWAVHPLADLLLGALRRESWVSKASLATFVPLHRRRERERGFNQAEELAREAARELRLPVRRTLLRLRDTPPQGEPTTLSRKGNVAGAFGLAPRLCLAGRTVLLVDDVYTSGATAIECSKLLRRAGARRVYVATAARGGLESFACESPILTASPG